MSFVKWGQFGYDWCDAVTDFLDVGRLQGLGGEVGENELLHTRICFDGLIREGAAADEENTLDARVGEKRAHNSLADSARGADNRSFGKSSHSVWFKSRKFIQT